MATIATGGIRVLDLLAVDEASAATRTMIKTNRLEVFRLSLAANQASGNHVAPSDMTIQNLNGEVELTASDVPHRLAEHQVAFLPIGTRHSLVAKTDAVLLLTSLLSSPRTPSGFDPVDEAGMESFPASDPPAY